VRTESGEECRTGFVNTQMVLLIYANPQIEITCECKIKHEQPADRGDIVNLDFKAPPELIIAHVNQVFFAVADGEDVVHE
jgi:hypothetical protein